jgi:hypothetical protein
MSKSARYAELNSWLLQDLAPQDLGNINEVKVSNYIAQSLGLDGWKNVIEIYRAEPSFPAAKANTFSLEPYGGAITDGRPDININNAFIHRQVDTDFVIDSFYGTGSGEQQKAEEWRDRFATFLRGPNGFSNGQVYQNYPEPDLKDWEQAYFAEALPRLREVKRQVDPPSTQYPEGFFHFPQSIRP